MAADLLPVQKPRWGELDDEENDENDYYSIWLPKQVIGPDEHGVKKVVEYKFNNDGHKVKITTTTRVRTLANTRLSKHAVERRSWLKFGDAVHEDVGARLTMVSTEEIIFERPKAQGEDTNVSGDSLAQTSKGGAILIVCRSCGKKGDHWTSKCPNKDLVENSNTSESSATGVEKRDTYVPPIKRAGGRRNEENSVRVSNLSEDTREPDLHELFRPFGNVSRVYVAMDQKSGISRGFGFVNFVRREDGERAIGKLNGYGYDNLILAVEWAAPRAN